MDDATGTNFLDGVQDKYAQKLHYSSHGIPVAQSFDIVDEHVLHGLLDKHGILMLKSKR